MSKELEALKAILEKKLQDEAEIEALIAKFTISSEKGSVAIQGDATEAVIVTGNKNIVQCNNRVVINQNTDPETLVKKLHDLLHTSDIHQNTQGGDAAVRDINKSNTYENCTFIQLLAKDSNFLKNNLKTANSVDDLVQQVRTRLYDSIQSLHATMPLWGIDHWVSLGDLFVDVNILKSLSSSRRTELDDLWQDFTTGNSNYCSLDRIGLGKQQQRLSGLEMLERNTNLMVVGKPGSGKTTYLQRIVTECNNGNLQAQRIPVLIKLREFVEDGRNYTYNLESYLGQLWRLSSAELELVLNQGLALVLLDGLDEVTGEPGKQIAKEIKQFARVYPLVQMVVTCRTQSQESRFERFDYVEVADFNEQQVRVFAAHWFTTVCPDAKEGETKTREFLQQLFREENKAIRELAITPILLSLTCAVFHQTGKFYSKRSKLYEEGLELLLEKWDKSREVERDEIYRDLSVERKLELLSFLAVKKFEQEQYVLFEQEELEGYIREFLGIERRESRGVLRAMASQHGLLIERAQKVWSFSHLTFQEYLVAKWFGDQTDWQKLVSHITKKNWREVFLLTTQMLDDANNFLQLIKYQIDNLLVSDEKLQKYLAWLTQKANSLQFSYSQTAIRSLCMALTLDDPEDLSLPYSLGIDLDFNFLPDKPSNDERLISEYAVDRNLRLALVSTYSKGFRVSLPIVLEQIIDNELQYISSNKSLLKRKIKKLIKALPDWWSKKEIVVCYEEMDKIDQIDKWWQKYGKEWTKELRKIMINYRNYGYDWQFSEDQQKLLQDYYDSNYLLVNCMNSNCNINLQIKQEIEATLFLPVTEIEKCKRKKLE